MSSNYPWTILHLSEMLVTLIATFAIVTATSTNELAQLSRRVSTTVQKLEEGLSVSASAKRELLDYTKIALSHLNLELMIDSHDHFASQRAILNRYLGQQDHAPTNQEETLVNLMVDQV